jgi:hypothetical protein
LDQPAGMASSGLSRHRAGRRSSPLFRRREEEYRWQLCLPCRGFNEFATARHATIDLCHPSKPIAPLGVAVRLGV